MRILLFSVSPWIYSAYGKNCANICSRLKEHHQVAIYSYTNSEAILDWDGIPVFHRPFKATTIPHATKFLRNWFEEWDADLVLQHFDVWTCGEELKNSGVPFLTYTPIDHSPLPPRIARAIDGNNCAEIVAMSKFAKKQFKEAGFDSTYVPHGVDTKLYRPIPEEKTSDLKTALTRGDPDGFVFGGVITNKGPRKNIPSILKAFKIFLEENPDARDAYLYLHCYVHHDNVNPEGYELPHFWNELGIEDRIVHVKPWEYVRGIPEKQMPFYYNCFDILLQTTFGEGFGLPVIEAGACKVPSISTNFSALPELVEGRGWLVDPVDYIAWELSSSWQAVVKPEHIADKMGEAYNSDEKRRKYGEEAHRFAQTLDWDKVVGDYWIPLLDRVYEEIHGYGETYFKMRDVDESEWMVIEERLSEAEG